MNKSSGQKVYAFEDFRFDAEHLMLYQRGETIPLVPKAAETLLALIERRGEILSKDELIERIWPDAFVEESNLFLYLSVLRKTLGNQRDGKPYLETLRRRGYRFNGDVRLVPIENNQNGTAVSLAFVKPFEAIQPVFPVGGLPPNVITSEAVREEVTPKSKRWLRRRTLLGSALIVAATVVVAAFAYSYFTSRPRIDSIAVMPFVNESGDAEVEFLSDGMTEELIDRLSKVPNLHVRARSTVIRYKGKDIDPGTIGKELNVGAILYGYVVQRGDDLTLRVELVDAQTGDRLWEQAYPRKMSRVMFLQSDVARSLVSKLRIKLSGETEKELARNYTENVDAYRLFIKGQILTRSLNQTKIKNGIALMQQAIDTDPSYALAYAGIAEAYRILAMAADIPPDDAFPKAKAMADKALEIDDTLAIAHSNLGAAITFYDWNWGEAAKHFLRALELDPNSASAHFSYGDFLGRMGHRKDSCAEIKRAAEIEPDSALFKTFEANCLNNPEHSDEAIEGIRMAIDLDPDLYLAHMTAGGIYGGKGMDSECLAEYRLAKTLAPDQTWADVGLASALVRMKKTNEARAILNELLARSKTRFVPPYHIASIYNRLGDTDKAFAYLDEAYKIRDPKMTFLKTLPAWNNLRDDPRFQDLVRRVGLP